MSGADVRADRARTKDEVAAAVARDIAAEHPDGAFVNLGIGQPTLVADHLAAGSGVVLHTENGMLNMGPAAKGDEIDPDLVNAGKVPVTELPGSAYFHHADSFAMMRGGHLDVCVLGAFQVSVMGDLANWHAGAPDAIPAVGGATDLAIGAKRVWVVMTLFGKDGSAKLVPTCSYPLTGVGCIDRVYTDLATFDLGAEGVVVRDLHGIAPDELASRLASVGPLHFEPASQVTRP
jgi:3-oxoadipate CoA-transferase beta subunit